MCRKFEDFCTEWKIFSSWRFYWAVIVPTNFVAIGMVGWRGMESEGEAWMYGIFYVYLILSTFGLQTILSVCSSEFIDEDADNKIAWVFIIFAALNPIVIWFALFSEELFPCGFKQKIGAVITFAPYVFIMIFLLIIPILLNNDLGWLFWVSYVLINLMVVNCFLLFLFMEAMEDGGTLNIPLMVLNPITFFLLLFFLLLFLLKSLSWCLCSGNSEKMDKDDIVIKNVNQAACNEFKECVICLDSIEGQVSICLVDCGHRYHQECINKWIEKDDNCPICRRKIIKHLTVENAYLDPLPC
ncbi:unnamed protein product [Moneuplotes crassus]|uniref:RING-type domain-containing protein n=1 Tax=Euplotes crassus TaxID=5936 RepID=A0AAD1XMV8_EUPCR|nr:unnamed protein product [Moneuplotes crassus]